jgi:hypothetical protein
MGRTPVLTSRDHRRLLCLTKKNPCLEYNELLKVAGMWDDQNNHPNVSTRTVQRALEE